jgi:hypothetical protein
MSVRLIAARVCHGDSFRHIVVTTVYAMRCSCNGVESRQSQQIVKQISCLCFCNYFEVRVST